MSSSDEPNSAKQRARHEDSERDSRLAEFAKPVEQPADRDGPGLSKDAVAALRQIAASATDHAAAAEPQRDTRGVAGQGNSVLLAGGSARTRAIAAGLLARELQRPLYRVDLEAVESRYIGETEKNLQHLFSSAARKKWILFFDEADALFGKRTDVKDAHDRYASIEVSFLLERIEQFGGLAILATNRRENLDPAFIRRLRHIIELPPSDPD